MATTTKKEQSVINQIIIKAPTRKTHDVGEWRTALRSADMGRLKPLYDLYDDLLIDGVLSDAVDKRILAITNSAITFQNASGEEVDEITELIDLPDFEELLKSIMNRLMWGRSGGEFDFTDGFHFEPIPAKHISLESKSILVNAWDASGIPYEGDDHLLILGKSHQFGLMLKTAPYAIWKRGGFGDYAQWLEIFGMPQRVGKYSSYDPQSRKLLEQALEQAGSAPYVVIPKESEVETTNNTGSGSSGTSYNDFRRACNEEILITILGQTLTTMQNETGARSLGEVHKEVEEGKNRSDMRYVQRVLNFFVLPLLEKRGFPVSGGSFIFPEAAVELTVSDIVQLSDIMEIPQSFLHDKYSIPAPQENEPIARKQPATSPFPETDPDDGDIKNQDRSIVKKFFDFFVKAPAGAGASNGDLLTLNDDSLTDRIIRHAVQNKQFMPELFEFISTDLLTALEKKTISNIDLGFQYGYQSDAFRTAQELNIFHFSAAKDIAEIQKLNELYRESKSFEQFHRAASEQVDVFNKTWQKTEWQIATLMNESSQNYHRLKNKTRIFPNWKYVTVNDGKVREEHQALHGLVLPADDPLWDQIWPPNGWKCRCRVAAVMAGEYDSKFINESRERVNAYFDTNDWEVAKKSGFGVNRAASPNIFNENQMYIRKFPNQASKLLKDINYHTYGLKSYEAGRKTATTALPVYDGSANDFISGLKLQNGRRFITDYKDRLIEFDLKAKGDARLIKAVPETLKNPDEVWINDQGEKLFDRFVFLKYFTDKVMTVTAEVKSGKIYRINSYITAKETGEKYKFRNGLLIKKPKS